MARSVTVSVSMPPEMADKLDEEAEKHGMRFAPYVRQIIREHEGTPFQCTDRILCKDENFENGNRSAKEGAA